MVFLGAIIAFLDPNPQRYLKQKDFIWIFYVCTLFNTASPAAL
jgi:hypothetical protein